MMSNSPMARRALTVMAALLVQMTLGFVSAQAAAAPQTLVLMVFSDPLPGQEDAYEQWFAKQQVPALLSVPGVTSAQHFTDAKLELRHTARKTPQDLMIYTIVTKDPAKVTSAIAHRSNPGKSWPAASVASVQAVVYRAFRPEMKGAGGEPAGAKAGPSQTYLVVAYGDALAGKDDAFNIWYDTVHEPEMLANKGVVLGQRAVLGDQQVAPVTDPRRYLMLMTIATSDLPNVFRGILAGGPPSPALDRTRGYGYTFRAVGTAVTK